MAGSATVVVVSRVAENPCVPVASDGLFSIALHEQQWLGALSLYRSDAKGRYESNEIDACQLIAPHLRRALQLTKRLVRAEGLASGMIQALQGTARAILLLDGQAREIFSSEAAAHVLQHTHELFTR